MSKRLQVVLEEKELEQYQGIARRKGMTLAEWVRRTLRRAGRVEPLGDADKKLAVVRHASTHSFPTSDIDQMLGEIERGYTLGENQKRHDID